MTSEAMHMTREHPLAVLIRHAQDDFLKGASAPTDDMAMFVARRVLADRRPAAGGEVREEVARLVARRPDIFSDNHVIARRAASPYSVEILRERALAKADAILAMLSSVQGGGEGRLSGSLQSPDASRRAPSRPCGSSRDVADDPEASREVEGRS